MFAVQAFVRCAIGDALYALYRPHSFYFGALSAFIQIKLLPGSERERAAVVTMSRRSLVIFPSCDAMISVTVSGTLRWANRATPWPFSRLSKSARSEKGARRSHKTDARHAGAPVALVDHPSPSPSRTRHAPTGEGGAFYLRHSGCVPAARALAPSLCGRLMERAHR